MYLFRVLLRVCTAGRMRISAHVAARELTSPVQRHGSRLVSIGPLWRSTTQGLSEAGAVVDYTRATLCVRVD